MKLNYKNWKNITGVDAYINTKDYINVYSNIGDLINYKQNIIDPTAVLGILMKNYCIGDRTLVQGVSKVPWMSKIEDGRLVESELPPHQNIKLSDEDIATKLIEFMSEEVLDFVQDKKTIGILLSGGMDSRIVAGIIKKLQDEGKFTGDVVAITWGIENTRDVIYAERIATQFGWDFKHMPITSETLYENINIAGLRGAEYSPVHLHAMSDVTKLEGIDGILAGSYGDSIGRGEYSGRKINQLPPLLDKHLNHFSFLLKSVEDKSLEILKQDMQNARDRFPNRSETSYREMEMQMHYMRRQLNSCMSIIDEKIPLYQMFTSPKVFGFMWSLAPECRTDNIYEVMLGLLPGKLLNIPWARDGKIYNDSQATSEDNYSKTYHRYGDWLRNENREFVIEKITNGNLQKLGIFNNKSLEFWSKHWRKDNRPKADRLDEKMAWLASLSIFVETYDVQGVENQAKHTFIDDLRVYKSWGYEMVYHQAMTRFKK